MKVPIRQQLRRLDDDAAAGGLWQRRSVRLLVWVPIGFTAGGLIGFFTTLWATLTFSLLVDQYAVMIPILIGGAAGILGALVAAFTVLGRGGRSGT